MGLGVYEKIEIEIYDDMKDETVVQIAKSGNTLAIEYLMKKYKASVVAKCRYYFLIGADKDDIMQEGMIGLYKAIRDYNVNKLTSFRGFAKLCIKRQIITAIKASTRQKHIPLNSYISLNKPIYKEDTEVTLLDIIEGAKITDPEDLVISEEQVKEIENKMNRVLSDLEIEVLALYIEGESYQEIAEVLDRHVKSIDNALQRVKKKLERCLEIEKS